MGNLPAMNRYLIVDGLVNETGIRDEYEGEYLDPNVLGLSKEIQGRLEEWLKEYGKMHVSGYTDDNIIELLDSEGVSIAMAIANELPESKISYYSDARLTKQRIS